MSVHQITTSLLAKFFTTHTLKPTATMPKTAVPQRQMETRAKNKMTHPGKSVKSSQR